MRQIHSPMPRAGSGLWWASLEACAALGAGCDYGRYGGNTIDGDDTSGGSSGGGSGGGSSVHPDGYADPGVHGIELNLQVLDCRTCHGGDLTGASGPSCDGCHTPDEPTAWRSDCRFCHGGVEDGSGAPPANLDGSQNPEQGPFTHHSAHLHSAITGATQCQNCHAVPGERQHRLGADER